MVKRSRSCSATIRIASLTCWGASSRMVISGSPSCAKRCRFEKRSAGISPSFPLRAADVHVLTRYFQNRDQAASFRKQFVKCNHCHCRTGTSVQFSRMRSLSGSLLHPGFRRSQRELCSTSQQRPNSPFWSRGLYIRLFLFVKTYLISVIDTGRNPFNQTLILKSFPNRFF